MERKLNSLDYYIGVFDGEGCITCADNHGNPHIIISITNQCEDIVDDFISMFGGAKACYTQPLNDKFQWRWTVSSENMKAFLEAAQPISKIKKQQIAIALEFNKTIGIKGQHLTDKNRVLRYRLKDALQSLNGKKKGIANGVLCT